MCTALGAVTAVGLGRRQRDARPREVRPQRGRTHRHSVDGAARRDSSRGVRERATAQGDAAALPPSFAASLGAEAACGRKVPSACLVTHARADVPPRQPPRHPRHRRCRSSPQSGLPPQPRRSQPPPLAGQPAERAPRRCAALCRVRTMPHKRGHQRQRSWVNSNLNTDWLESPGVRAACARGQLRNCRACCARPHARTRARRPPPAAAALTVSTDSVAESTAETVTRPRAQLPCPVPHLLPRAPRGQLARPLRLRRAARRRLLRGAPSPPRRPRRTHRAALLPTRPCAATAPLRTHTRRAAPRRAADPGALRRHILPVSLAQRVPYRR